mgnify:CR=1 FL=1
MTSNTTIYSEYVITLKEYSDLDQFYIDMETFGGPLYVPDREVSVKHRRPNSRNTHYFLTGTEAELLKNDSRIISVTPVGLIDAIIRPVYTKTANFYRGPTNTDQVINWGLLRSIEGVQHANWGSDGQPSHVGTITYNALGENVDVIVIDGHIDATHPEFAVTASGEGGSRVVQFDWNTLTETAGLLDSEVHTVLSGTYLYTPYDRSPEELDVNNHGCHVAGTLAGNTQGWAKKANIYNISPYAQYNQNVTDVSGWALIMWDYIRAFHASKPVNPATGKKNPTICNCSYGTAISYPYDYGTFQTGPITRVYYRGSWYGNPLVPLTDNDLMSYGLYPIDGVVSVPYFDPAQAAEIEDAINDGIIVVGAAGNNYTRMVLPGNVDYSNIVSATINGISFSQYCHQGMSPGAAKSVICVGAATSRVTETKSYFSNCGPRVDVFAPGEYILSSVDLYGSIEDTRNPDYSLSMYSGTSMAAPQVAGVLACNLQTNPDLKQQDFRNYLNLYSKENQLTAGSGGAADTTDLQQAPNKYLFFEPVGSPLESTAIIGILSFPMKVPVVPIKPVTFTGGKAPFAISIYPSLPAGLNFNTVNSEISGTPTEFRFIYEYTVTITDAIGQITSKRFILEVTEPLSPDLVAVVNTASVTHLQYVPIVPYTPISYTGGILPVEFLISNALPTGLSFNDSTGQITGLPLTPSADFNYSVTITDSTRRQTTGSFSLAVLDSPKLITSASTSTFIFTKDVEITPVETVNATSGYGSYTYTISPAVPAGLLFNTATSVLSGTPTGISTITSYTVLVSDFKGQQDSTNFSIGISPPDVIIINTVTSIITCTQYVTNLFEAPITATGGYQELEYQIAPALPSSLEFDLSTGIISGITSEVIDQVYNVSITDLAKQHNSGTFRLIVHGPVNSISSQPLSFVQWYPILTPIRPVEISGGIVKKYEILEPLPSGLVFSTSTGVIYGTPYQSLSTTSFTVVITNSSDGVSAKQFNLYIEENTTVDKGFITPTGVLVTSTVSGVINTFVAAVGTGTTFEILTGELPPGLTLNSNGIISGTINS